MVSSAARQSNLFWEKNMETEMMPAESYHKPTSFYFFVKRIFDLCSASFLFICLIPLFLVIIPILFISNPGRVFFKDHRVGKNGKGISVYKFRTMYCDAETHPEKYLSAEQMKQWKEERKVPKDPRITPFGRFLRKTSLDEIPQLFNIIGGSMSVVGPRPITTRELEENYSIEQRQILLSTKPGLLGYWQVFARNDAKYETRERQKYELAYFQKQSVLMDLWIILCAIPSMFKHHGT
jgi:lipopolysaccharide/colanic/teichoic acid biosynthesis glycosyltransferase